MKTFQVYEPNQVVCAGTFSFVLTKQSVYRIDYINKKWFNMAVYAWVGHYLPIVQQKGLEPMTGTTSASLDQKTKDLLLELEQHRRDAIALIGDGRLDEAKQHANRMAEYIRHLEVIYKQRRGRPRSELEINIEYYAVWQQTLVARLVFEEEAKRQERHGAVAYKLISDALWRADRLATDHPGVEELKELKDEVYGYFLEISRMAR